MKLEVQIRTRGVTVEGWREAYYSEAFSRLVVEQTGLRERTLLERTATEKGERCRVRVVPRINLPGPVRKLVGQEQIAYTEVSTYDAVSGRGQLEIESPAADEVWVNGEIRYQLQDGVVQMRFAGEVKVKVFAIGGLIERFIAAEVRKRYGTIEPLLQQFVDTQSAAQG